MNQQLLEVLGLFLSKCSDDLNEIHLETPSSVGDLRRLLLGCQEVCLERVINSYQQKQHNELLPSKEELLVELRNLPMQEDGDCEYEALRREVNAANSQMNHSARLAFCRLVLWSEVYAQRHRSSVEKREFLQKVEIVERADILEFCGMCTGAMQLDTVRTHIQTGTPLFAKDQILTKGSVSASKMIMQKPFERLEGIQRLYLRALGYEPDKALSKIKEMFFEDTSRQDPFLAKEFLKMMQCTKDVVVGAKGSDEVKSTGLFSDHDEGGVTRVVDVQYSDRIVNPMTGQETSSSMSAPGEQRMRTEDLQRQQLQMAQRAAALEQEILAELLSMEEKDRELRLLVAKDVTMEFLSNVQSKPPGPDRIAALQAVDAKTQRYMAMHKAWEKLLASNGGKKSEVR